MTEEKKKKISYIVLFSLTGLVLIAVSIIVGISISDAVKAEKQDQMDRSFDYMTTDLSNYVDVDESVYKNISVSVDIDSVTEADVDNRILKDRAAHKEKTPLTDAEANGRALDAGDVVKIYYRGYTRAADGSETEIDGTTNFASKTATELGLGTGAFIPGFELSLVGVDPAAYTVKKVGEGTVKEGDTVFLSYSVILPTGGNETVAYRRVNLADPAVDDRFGAGFCDYLIGKEIGKTVSSIPVAFPLPDGVGDAAYTDLTVNFVLDRDAAPLTINAYFPYDYGATESGSASELAGKHILFDIYFDDVTYYNAPALDDAFVTETLGYTEEKLSSYSGENAVEKYKKLIRAELDDNYEKTKKSLIGAALFSHYNEVATVKRCPPSLVSDKYSEYYANLYAQYSSMISTMEDGEATLQNYAYALAENDVMQSMILYAVIRHAGLLLNKGAEYDASYREIFDEQFASYVDYTYRIALDDYSDIPGGKTAKEQYDEETAQFVEEFTSAYDANIREDVQYYHAIDTLISYASVMVTDPRTAE